MPSNRGSDRNYWRTYAQKKKALARYDSGEPLTGAQREDDEVLWANLLHGLKMARHHLRDAEYVHAAFDVVCATERAWELQLRGQQLIMQLMELEAQPPPRTLFEP